MANAEIEDGFQEGVLPSRFPAATKRASAVVDDIETEVMSVFFADKLLITISQEGRLAQWVPLEAGALNSIAEHQTLQSEDSLLPLAHLTPRTILGGADLERESLGQLYAAQIATAIAMRNPEERRTVVLGLGFRTSSHDRQTFIDILGLVSQCL